MSLARPDVELAERLLDGIRLSAPPDMKPYGEMRRRIDMTRC